MLLPERMVKLMSFITRLNNKIMALRNPVKYAKKVGVNLLDASDIKLLSTNFGSEPWLITIGRHVELSGNVVFITHDGATWVFRNRNQLNKYSDVIRYGKIIIKDNCFIGMNSVILPGITIGPNSIVGAGSIVTKDVPPNSVYAGNPAHMICSVEEYAEKCLRETPDYNIEAYHKNKKEELLRILQ